MTEPYGAALPDSGPLHVHPRARCGGGRRPFAAAAAAAAAANGMLALCHHAASALVTPAVPPTKPSLSQGPSIQPKAPPEHLRVVEDFLDADFAGELRGCFDEHFAEPRQAHPMRFVWDYWHVPGQYTLHRTQAANYFSPDEFDALTDALTQYGQERLGCRTISPPWLSFYIDGCEQQVHGDFGDPSRTRTHTRTRTLTLTRTRAIPLTAGARGRAAGPAGVRALSHAMGGGQLTLTLTRARTLTLILTQTRTRTRTRTRA